MPQARRRSTLNAKPTGRTRRNRALGTVRRKLLNQAFAPARAFSGLAVPLLAGGPGRVCDT